MNVLLVEDNVSLATLLSMLMEGEGITVTMVHDGAEGARKIEQREFDVMVTDIRMPGLSGHELFEIAKKTRPEMPVIIMTAYGTIPDAVQAIRNGAYNYITKPFENDDFLHAVKKALELRTVQQENSRLRKYVKDSVTPEIVGNSPAFQETLTLVETVAPTTAPVLILGESGTGKELIARKIHSISPRADKQFVTVNCAAIPETLFESELFGHKKGSFTGADRDYKGKIAEADGGTLFLDEIGELPLAVQVKLLRFLQESEVQPVGASLPVKVNVRVVAATNRDLRSLADAGDFREDLYYRLNVFPVRVPPLARRRDDIPSLVALFAKRYGGKNVTFGADAIDRLKNYPWPGNIRELENTVYRLCIMKGNGVVTASDLPQEINPDPFACLNMSLPDDCLDLEEVEKSLIMRVLQKFGGNKSKAATYLCIPRHVLLYRLEKYKADTDGE